MDNFNKPLRPRPLTLHDLHPEFGTQRLLENILEDEKLLCLRGLENVFKTCLQDVLKINKCLLGKVMSC